MSNATKNALYFTTHSNDSYHQSQMPMTTPINVDNINNMNNMSNECAYNTQKRQQLQVCILYTFYSKLFVQYVVNYLFQIEYVHGNANNNSNYIFTQQQFTNNNTIPKHNNNYGVHINNIDINMNNYNYDTGGNVNNINNVNKINMNNMNAMYNNTQDTKSNFDNYTNINVNNVNMNPNRFNNTNTSRNNNSIRSNCETSKHYPQQHKIVNVSIFINVLTLFMWLFVKKNQPLLIDNKSAWKIIGHNYNSMQMNIKHISNNTINIYVFSMPKNCSLVNIALNQSDSDAYEKNLNIIRNDIINFNNDNNLDKVIVIKGIHNTETWKYYMRHLKVKDNVIMERNMMSSVQVIGE